MGKASIRKIPYLLAEQEKGEADLLDDLQIINNENHILQLIEIR